MRSRTEYSRFEETHAKRCGSMPQQTGGDVTDTLDLPPYRPEERR
jgi:hypothetical protein